MADPLLSLVRMDPEVVDGEGGCFPIVPDFFAFFTALDEDWVESSSTRFLLGDRGDDDEDGKAGDEGWIREGRSGDVGGDEHPSEADLLLLLAVTEVEVLNGEGANSG